MRKYKYRAAKLFHIVLWSIIFILSINVLIKCIRILGPEKGGFGRTFGEMIVSAACNYMAESQIPIVGYVANNGDDNYISNIFNAMAGDFPINHYIAQASEEVGNNYIEEKQSDSLYFATDPDLLLNNDLYVQRILEGIEQNDSVKENTYSDSNNVPGKGDSVQVTTNSIMPIDIINGEVYLESEDTNIYDESAAEALGTINGEHFTLNQLLNRQFLYNNFYIVDSATVTDDELFDARKLLGKDMTMKTSKDKPQILIYHTHSQETYSDSRKGRESDTVVGVGSYLTVLLEEKYGYNVIHDKTKYDLMGGSLDRNLAYNYARKGIEKILEENPSVEVIIDLHRDGAKNKRVTKINGKDTAQIMFFNGLCRNAKGEIENLKNPYIQDNLAFSFQLQLKGRELFPGLMYKNYLQYLRYNQHLRKKSLLIELGTDKNTVEEAMNAMDYLAVVLDEVLKGSED